MKLFKCYDGYEVDLDNESTYFKYPNTTDELRNLMFQEIGYVHCYINYWHPNWDSKQEERINILIQNFTEHEQVNRNNVMWYKEQIYRFQDETENMC